MAYAKTGSMNAAFSEGSTDRKYKKVVQDRGGVVESTTYESRADLYDGYYGIHEKNPKVAPDGLLHNTPDYYPTPTPQSLGDVIP